MEGRGLSNEAAIGYAIIAAKKLGLAGDKLVQLEEEMKDAMDIYTEEEAEEVYRKL